jgi:competence protein ComEC
VGKALPFWDRTIELVVLTHPDNDHLTGLVEILRRYHVQRVLTSGIESNSETFATWRRLLAEKNIETVTAEKGMRIVLSDGIHITVLHPPGSDESKPEDPNESSVVLRLEYDNFRLLLPGDIGTETERDLLRGDQDLQSTVLKVAHHGSATATSAEFLNEVRPSIAVISVGRENPFGHPSEATVARLKEAVGENGLYLTSQDGTVEFTTDGKKLWVKTQR